MKKSLFTLLVLMLFGTATIAQNSNGEAPWSNNDRH